MSLLIGIQAFGYGYLHSLTLFAAILEKIVQMSNKLENLNLNEIAIIAG